MQPKGGRGGGVPRVPQVDGNYGGARGGACGGVGENWGEWRWRNW
jgi:hypothetical protein